MKRQMSEKSAKSRPSSGNRNGLTLVEVIAGIALAATLLVSVLMAHAAHVRQIRTAQRQEEAIQAIDQLLTKWFSEGKRIPESEEGTLPDRPNLRWRTAPLPSTAANELNSKIVRVAVFDAVTASHDHPLCAVEILAPLRTRGSAGAE